MVRDLNSNYFEVLGFDADMEMDIHLIQFDDCQRQGSLCCVSYEQFDLLPEKGQEGCIILYWKNFANKSGGFMIELFLFNTEHNVLFLYCILLYDRQSLFILIMLPLKYCCLFTPTKKLLQFIVLYVFYIF